MHMTHQRLAKVALVLFFSATLCAGLTACQSEDDNQQGVTQIKTVGEATQDVFALKMSNSAGVSVVGMQVKLPGEEQFSANMLSSDQRISNGETVELNIPKNASANAETYFVDLKVTFNTGGTSVLHHLDLKDFATVTLLLQGKVGYVTYQSTVAMRMVSTLELQQHYYNLEDPNAAARDKAEEEEEKRRLEKLEEDLRSYEQTSASGNTSNATNEEEDVQDPNLEDDPIETNYDGPED